MFNKQLINSYIELVKMKTPNMPRTHYLSFCQRKCSSLDKNSEENNCKTISIWDMQSR